MIPGSATALRIDRLSSMSNNRTRPERSAPWEIAIADIEVGERLRELDRAKVGELAASIRLHGRLLQPIIVTETGRLVAGHHRLESCRVLGWTSIAATVVPDDPHQVILAEIDENLCRNDLSVMEQAEHLLRRDDLLTAAGLRAPGHRPPAASKGETAAPFVTTGDIATNAGMSKRSVQQRLQIARGIPPEVRDVLRGTAAAESTRALLELARLMNAEEQPRLARLLAQGRAKTVREARGLIKLSQRREQIEKLKREGVAPLPAGPWGVIVIDPPWQYNCRQDDPSHDSMSGYPSMSLEEIKALPIPDLLANDSMVWLWTTNAHLPDAFGVLETWDLKYRTTMTWAKKKPSIGRWLRGLTEHVLLATRGCPVVEVGPRITTLLTTPNTGKHSEKPTEFFDLVEAMCPDPRRLELFARTERSGWASWGLEVGQR